MKNLICGAGTRDRLPLNVFADLHKKKSRIFACENRRFLSKKREASMSVNRSCGSKSDFLELDQY